MTGEEADAWLAQLELGMMWRCLIATFEMDPTRTRLLRELIDFLAGKDVDAARLAVSAIRKKVALLAQSRVSAGSPRLEPEHRELLDSFGANGYVVLYHATPDLILILSVRHQKEVGY